MPNQLPDGGQLAKQNSPVILTIDEGLATNNFKNANQPVYDSRALGRPIMIVDVTLPSQLYLSPPDQGDSGDPGDPDNPPIAEPPYAGPYNIIVDLSDGAGTEEKIFASSTIAGGGTSEISFLLDDSALQSGRYNLVGNVSFKSTASNTLGATLYTADGDPANAPITGVVNVINRTDNPSTGSFHSEFGNGWTLPGLDRLFIQTDSPGQPAGVAAVTGDDQFTWFELNDDNATFKRFDGPYDFSNLTRDTHGSSNPADYTYKLTDPDGTIRNFDGNGLETTVVDRNGNVLKTFHYADKDGDGLEDEIDWIRDNVDRTTTFNYAVTSKLVKSITDFAGRVTTLTQDSLARLTSITAPDPDGLGPEIGPLTQYAYSGTLSYLTSVTDPRGLVTTVDYDAFNDVQQVTDPTGHSIQITSIPSQYTTLGAGEASEIRNVYGNISQAERDDYYNVTELTDAANKTWTYQYNDTNPDHETGLLISVTPPSPDPDYPDELKTQYFYAESTGELLEVINPDGSQEGWAYDSFGEVETHSTIGTGIYNPLLITNAYSPDANGNYAIVEQYGGGGDPATINHYTYTDSLEHATDELSKGVPLGLVKTMTDSNGNLTVYTYTAHGLISSITSASGTSDETTTHYYYDGNDNLREVVDGLLNETDYKYDNLNRLVQITEPAPASGVSQPLWKYAYDAAGNLVATTDPLGNITQSVYDALNHQIQVIQPVADPNATPFTSTLAANTAPSSSVVLSWGNGWTSSSPAGSYGTSVESTSGNSGYGASATFTFSSLALNPNKKYLVLVHWVPDSSTTYDSDAQWSVFGDPTADPVITQTVDLNRAPQGLADSMGLMWLSLGAFSPYVVNSSHHTITVTLSDSNNNGLLTVDAVRLVEVGPVTQYGYDPSGNTTSLTDPKGNLTQYTYDNLNRLKLQTDPIPADASSHPLTQYNYNAVGWLTSVTDPMNRTTSYLYDSVGNQTGIIQPAGPQGLLAQYYPGTYEWYGLNDSTPAHSKLDSQVNFSPTSSNFDGFSDVNSGFSARWTGAINLAAGSYDFALQTGASNQNVRQLIIDGQTVIGVSQSEVTLNLSGGWHSIEIDYFHATGDASLVLEYAPVGGSLSPVLSSMLSPVWKSDYDAAGRNTIATDPLGNITRYQYNQFNQITQFTDGKGNTTYYLHDGNGNLTNEFDADSNLTTWVYNGLNLATSQTDQSNDITTYDYDADGNLYRKTDAKGQITRYAYDHLNRLTAERWLAGDDNSATIQTISYGYDADNRLIATTERDGNGAPTGADDTFTPDNLGRATSVTQTIVGLTPVITLTQQFDSNSNRTQLSAAIGGTGDFQNTYTFDALNHLRDVTQQQQNGGTAMLKKWVDFTYKADGQFDTITRNTPGGGTVFTPQRGIQSRYIYNDAGQITSIGYTSVVNGVVGASYGTHYDYTYDDAGQVKTFNYSEAGDWGDGITYGYDSSGQLTGATHTSGSESYTYDDNGNRTSVNGTNYGTPGPDNRVTSDGVYDYQYDKNGNLTKKFLHNTTTLVTQYDYDFRNRLTTVTFKNTSTGATTKIVGYTYDAFDRLVGKTVTNSSGTITDHEAYAFDGKNMILRFTGSGTGFLAASTLTDRYLWGPKVDQILADEVLNRWGFGGDEVDWAITDAQNTVRMVQSSTSLLTENHYTAFGVKTAYNPGLDILFGYTAGYTDPDTGLILHGERWYSPTLGSWMTKDPIYPLSGANSYKYAYNNPTNFVDPSGLWGTSGNGNTPPGFWSAFASGLGYGATTIYRAATYPLRGLNIDFSGLDNKLDKDAYNLFNSNSASTTVEITNWSAASSIVLLNIAAGLGMADENPTLWPSPEPVEPVMPTPPPNGMGSPPLGSYPWGLAP